MCKELVRPINIFYCKQFTISLISRSRVDTHGVVTILAIMNPRLGPKIISLRDYQQMKKRLLALIKTMY